MTTYRIEYKWRENDYGQALRPWRHTFKLIKSNSLDEALIQFKNQDWQVEYEIKETLTGEER